jgi:hypothetical protein
LIVALAVSTTTGAITLAMSLAPVAALGAAIWAGWTGLKALWELYDLAHAGQILTDPQTLTLLSSLETVERVGFLALSYLALIFALITLMGGLLGRRWGRLYILPGAIFTATAMALFTVGLLFAAPLAAKTPVSEDWLIALAIYALMDAPVVSGALVDTRLTRSPTATGRHRVVRLVRKSRPAARSKRRSPPPT